MLDLAMKDIDREFWTSYLDDILMFSRQPWEPFGDRTPVDLAQTAAGIKIQLCKTKLFQNKVEYLGHRISKEGNWSTCSGSRTGQSPRLE